MSPSAGSTVTRAGTSKVDTPQPTTVARTATTTDSPTTFDRTWRGVAPTSRSRPTSRRRAATMNEKVLATTNIARKKAMPDIIPNMAARPSNCSSCSSGRSWPRVVSTAPIKVTAVAMRTTPKHRATKAPM